MDWSWYFSQILFKLTDVVPWLLGGLLGLGVFSFSPLGREILHRLRVRRHETVMNEATLQELSEIRQLLIDVSERLDSTERRLGQALSDRLPLQLPPVPGGVSPSDRPPVTPH